MNSKSRKLKDNILRNIEKPYFAYLRDYGFPEDIEKKFLEELYPEEIVVQVKEQKIFDTNNDLIYHEITKGYYAEKALMTYLEDSIKQGKIFWYPHSMYDLHFLNEVLMEKSINPNLIIMNDIMNAPENIDLNAEISGWTVDNYDVLYLEVSQEELSHHSMTCYSINQERTGKRINLLYMSGVDSNDLLRYFCDTNLNISYVFTHRAEGGLNLELLSELNNKVFISDFHGIGNESIDGDNSDLQTLKSYAERLGFKVCGNISNKRSVGCHYYNLLICEWGYNN